MSRDWQSMRTTKVTLILDMHDYIIEWSWVGYEEFYRSTKAKFHSCFIIHSKYFSVLKGVLPFRSLFFCSPKITQPHPQVFLVQEPAAGCTFDAILMSLVQYDKTFDVIGSTWQSSFQIWSTAASYGELCMALTNQKWGNILNV